MRKVNREKWQVISHAPTGHTLSVGGTDRVRPLNKVLSLNLVTLSDFSSAPVAVHSMNYVPCGVFDH